MLEKKWPSAVGYIPYFQANTNTYAPLSVLRKKYETALSFEKVVGLSIATRADAIADEVYDYLEEIAHRTYLTVELGLQTIHDETARRINRGHSFEEFRKAVMKLDKRGIPVCVHIINGLPFETKEMMVETAKVLSSLPIHSLKIHLLHVVEGTRLAEEWKRGDWETLSLEEYVDIVCDQIELLPPLVTIQRVTGDGERESLLAPLWSLKKFVVMNEIDKELVRRDSYQGKRYSPPPKKERR